MEHVEERRKLKDEQIHISNIKVAFKKVSLLQFYSTNQRISTYYIIYI